MEKEIAAATNSSKKTNMVTATFERKNIRKREGRMKGKIYIIINSKCLMKKFS